MEPAPDPLVGGELDEGFVPDLQEPRLLEVRRCDPPAPLEIAIQPIPDQIAERAIRLSEGQVLDVRVLGVVGHRQPEGVDDSLSQ